MKIEIYFLSTTDYRNVLNCVSTAYHNSDYYLNRICNAIITGHIYGKVQNAA